MKAKIHFRIFLFSVIFSFWLICSLEGCKEKEKEPADLTDIKEILDLAEKYGEKEEIEKALLFAKRAYALEPNNEKVRFQLSKVYATIGGNYFLKSDCDETKIYSKKAIEIYKDNDGANSDLAACALAEKKFEECIEYSKEYLRLDKKYGSNSNSPYNSLGVCYSELRKYDLAISNFLESIKRNPLQRTELYNFFSLGSLYFIREDKTNSKKYLSEFMQKYEALSNEKLRKELLPGYEEALSMIKIISSGVKIKFPKDDKSTKFNNYVIKVIEASQPPSSERDRGSDISKERVQE